MVQAISLAPADTTLPDSPVPSQHSHSAVSAPTSSGERPRKRQRCTARTSTSTPSECLSPTPPSDLLLQEARTEVTRVLDEACHTLAEADKTSKCIALQTRESLSAIRRSLRSLRWKLDWHELLDPQFHAWDCAERRPASPTQRVLDSPVRLAKEDVEWMFPLSEDPEDGGRRVDEELLCATNAKLQQLFPGECLRSPTPSERYLARSRFYEIMDAVRPTINASTQSKVATKTQSTQTTPVDKPKPAPKPEKVYTVRNVTFEELLKRTM